MPDNGLHISNRDIYDRLERFERRFFDEVKELKSDITSLKIKYYGILFGFLGLGAVLVTGRINF